MITNRIPPILLLAACSLSILQCGSEKTLSLELVNSYEGDTAPKLFNFEKPERKYDSLFRNLYSVATGSNSPDIKFLAVQEFGAFSAIKKQTGARYILYSKALFDSIYNHSRSLSPINSVIAHELTHLFQNHALQKKDRRQFFENEADLNSGSMMRLVGVSLNDAILPMQLIGNTQGTATHPGKEDRIKKIKEGWVKEGLRMLNTISESYDSILFEEIKESLMSGIDSIRREQIESDFRIYIEYKRKFLQSYRSNKKISRSIASTDTKGVAELILLSKKLDTDTGERQFDTITPDSAKTIVRAYSINGILIRENLKSELLDSMNNPIGSIKGIIKGKSHKSLIVYDSEYILKYDGTVTSKLFNGRDFLVGSEIQMK